MQDIECDKCKSKSFTVQRRGFNIKYALAAFIPVVLMAMLIWHDIIPDKNDPMYRLEQATDELQREKDRLDRANGYNVPYREIKEWEDPTKNVFYVSLTVLAIVGSVCMGFIDSKKNNRVCLNCGNSEHLKIQSLPNETKTI